MQKSVLEKVVDERKRDFRLYFGTCGIINEETERNILSCLERKWITYGPMVDKFERLFAETFGYKRALATGNGTIADTMAFMLPYHVNTKPSLNRFDNEIIVPALAFIAVGEAIYQAGFNPKFVDVDRSTQNINPDLIKRAITPKTRAIVAVHSLGKPCDMDPIVDIAKRHNLVVIEDSCEAHGAKYKGQYVGHFGDAATFSSFAAHLICTGEGGVVATNKEHIVYALEKIRNHGRNPENLYFDHIALGVNGKMNDLEASVGIPQVKGFWDTFNKRKENLNYLLEKVDDLKEFVYFNEEEVHEELSPHAFSLVLKEPRFNYKKLYAYLQDNGIQCKRNFGSIPTQHKAFEFLGYKIGDFPESEYVGDNGLHFAVHQDIGCKEMDYASDKLHDYFLNSKFEN